MSEEATTTTPAEQAPNNEPKTFSEDYVKTLRDEAAQARVAKKDAVAQAEADTRAAVVGEYEPQLAAKDTEITELKGTVATQGTELLKLKAVIEAQVPTEDVLTVVELVQGADEESISQSVKRVLSIYGKKQGTTPAFDPSQGHGGGTIPLNGDAVTNLLKAKLGIA